MEREKVLEAYKGVFPELEISLIEKGIAEDGWYSNERNGKWLPIVMEMPLLDFRKGMTEFRPKTLKAENIVPLPKEEFDKLVLEYGDDIVTQQRGIYHCPSCKKIDDTDIPEAMEVSTFEWAPDPHNVWRELHLCGHCKTNYVIYNGT